MEPILPDKEDQNSQFGVRRIIDQIDEIKDKTDDEKYDELFYYLNQYNGWVNGLKPVIEDRIKAYRQLNEVAITGKESVSEVGTRFIIASLVAKELEGLIEMVEARARQIAEDKRKKKHAV
jgi:hypothetical protein